MRYRLKRILPSALASFLAARPEWEDEVALKRIDGQDKACVTTNCLMAFVAWCKENGVGNQEKVCKFLRDFEDTVDRQMGK